MKETWQRHETFKDVKATSNAESVDSYSNNGSFSFPLRGNQTGQSGVYNPIFYVQAANQIATKMKILMMQFLAGNT